MRRAGSAAWARVRPETVLYVGDTVRARQTAQITFLDGAIAILEPASFLEIISFDPHRKALHLKTESVSIETDAAQAKISVSEAGLEVITDSGYVHITTNGKKHTLQAGQIAQLVFGQDIILQDRQVVVMVTPSPSPSPILALPASPTALPSRAPSIARPYLPLVMGAYTPTPTRIPSATSTTQARTPSVPATAVPPALVSRVNCGGGAYKDKAGQLWAADQRYKEGGWG